MSCVYSHESFARESRTVRTQWGGEHRRRESSWSLGRVRGRREWRLSALRYCSERGLPLRVQDQRLRGDVHRGSEGAPDRALRPPLRSSRCRPSVRPIYNREWLLERHATGSGPSATSAGQGPGGGGQTDRRDLPAIHPTEEAAIVLAADIRTNAVEVPHQTGYRSSPRPTRCCRSFRSTRLAARPVPRPRVRRRTDGGALAVRARGGVRRRRPLPARVDEARALGLDTSRIHNAGALAFGNREFDVVVCVEVLEPQRAATEALRVLARAACS